MNKETKAKLKLKFLSESTFLSEKTDWEKIMNDLNDAIDLAIKRKDKKALDELIKDLDKIIKQTKD